MTLQEVCAEIEASNASPEAKATMQRIAERAEYAMMTPEEQAEYDTEQKRIHDSFSVLDYAKNKGREEGREEEALKIAKNMKDKGYAVEDIIEMTGLSEDQVAGL